MKKTFFVIAFIFTVFYGGLSAFFFLSMLKLHWIHTSGTIVNIQYDKNASGKIIDAPVIIQFKTPKGMPVTFNDSMAPFFSGNITNIRIGDRIKIIYPPRHPHSALIDSDTRERTVLRYLLFTTLIFALIAWWLRPKSSNAQPELDATPASTPHQ